MRKVISKTRFLGVTLMSFGLAIWTAAPISASFTPLISATNGRFTVPTDGQSFPAQTNGKIAFVSSSSSDSAIHTIDPDGENLSQLTSGQPLYNPLWSPSGAQLAFVRGASNQQEKIFVVNSDGSNQVNLTPSDEGGFGPAWSPDGTKIAFVRSCVDRGFRHPQIFTVNVDGSNERRLTHDDVLWARDPTWSPDGTKIAFSGSHRSTSRNSFDVMNSDGSNQRILIQDPFHTIQGNWSPDGSKLVIVGAYALTGGFAVISADGSKVTPIPDSSDFDWDPAWSPDGSMIAFTRWTGYDFPSDTYTIGEIWLVNADGSMPRKLTVNSSGTVAYGPRWSPDGTKILFSIYDGKQADLYLMNVDGSEITNITNTADRHEDSPSWQSLSLTVCADAISRDEQSFDASGGIDSVDVRAGNDCSWTAASSVGWVSITTKKGSGNGSVSYSVAANTGTAQRTAQVIVAGHILAIKQAGVPVRINSASVAGKKLFVFGENFDDGAVILLNDIEHKTQNDNQNPRTTVIGKKAGKKVNTGDRLRVRNPNGTVSQEFIFNGAA